MEAQRTHHALGNAGVEFTWKFCLSKEKEHASLVPLLLLHIKKIIVHIPKLVTLACKFGSRKKEGRRYLDSFI